ncbi:MAG: dihydrolipoyl dehydrogenase [Oligoflexia bacterium]|nr:dihydrolipoyl dehydrogenase [Oligoflexia bacterium]
MSKKVFDVAVIGAGTAGLSTVSEIQRHTDNFVLINKGEYGTTCARVGCMPSKVLIQVANDFYSRKIFAKEGIKGSQYLEAKSDLVMKYVRSLRDRFVKSVINDVRKIGDKNLQGSARFLDPTILQVGPHIIKARKVIIATGTTPVIPSDWLNLKNLILTTDQLFEEKILPSSMVTVGLGPIGLEMGQALHRLGVKMTGVGQSKFIGNLSDPVVNGYAIKLLGLEFELNLGHEAVVKEKNKKLTITAGKKTYKVEKVLASLGRKPNLSGLGLKEIGIKFDKNEIPVFNINTLQVGKFPIFIVGDVKHYRSVLHEAADDGRIAGFNSMQKKPQAFERRIPLNITFCDPNIATVGKTFESLTHEKFITGESIFDSGRSIILGSTGILRIYGKPKTGLLLGAEMIAPAGEHLAHLIACMIHQKMTVFDALKLPIYHPTLEEGLRHALRDLSKQVTGLRPRLDLEKIK